MTTHDDDKRAAEEYAIEAMGTDIPDVIRSDKEAFLAGVHHERRRIMRAINFQAEDETIWFNAKHIGEAYLQQSLRWLHAWIEDRSEAALRYIENQSKGDI